MKKPLFSILIVLGMAVFTNCCDCRIENWTWKHCKSKKMGTLKMELTVSILPNCEALHINGTSENKLGKIQSVLVEADGTLNGIPVMSFSDPNACTFKEPSPDEPGTSLMRDMLPILFSKLEVQNFDIVLPLSEGEISAIDSLNGDFILNIRHKKINNVEKQSDCYVCSGTFRCTVEDY